MFSFNYELSKESSKTMKLLWNYFMNVTLHILLEIFVKDTVCF